MENPEYISIKDNISEHFSMPITFLKNKKMLNETVKKDLELTDCIDKEQKPIYEHLFKPSNVLGKEIIKNGLNIIQPIKHS